MHNQLLAKWAIGLAFADLVDRSHGERPSVFVVVY